MSNSQPPLQHAGLAAPLTYAHLMRVPCRGALRAAWLPGVGLTVLLTAPAACSACSAALTGKTNNTFDCTGAPVNAAGRAGADMWGRGCGAMLPGAKAR